jgi:hypothetical protein
MIYQKVPPHTSLFQHGFWSIEVVISFQSTLRQFRAEAVSLHKRVAELGIKEACRLSARATVVARLAPASLLNAASAQITTSEHV